VKTTISIPNDMFRAADRYARRAKMSRSQLYRQALAEYLARHEPDPVTDAVNQIVDELREPVDAFLAEATRRRLERSEW
jgi:predicted transcriptional regulator